MRWRSRSRSTPAGLPDGWPPETTRAGHRRFRSCGPRPAPGRAHIEQRTGHGVTDVEHVLHCPGQFAETRLALAPNAWMARSRSITMRTSQVAACTSGFARRGPAGGLRGGRPQMSPPHRPAPKTPAWTSRHAARASARPAGRRPSGRLPRCPARQLAGHVPPPRHRRPLFADRQPVQLAGEGGEQAGRGAHAQPFPSRSITVHRLSGECDSTRRATAARGLGQGRAGGVSSSTCSCCSRRRSAALRAVMS